MLGHWGDKAKIIHFSCDLGKRRSEGLIDNFTWRELEISGERKVFKAGESDKKLSGKEGVAETQCVYMSSFDYKAILILLQLLSHAGYYHLS